MDVNLLGWMLTLANLKSIGGQEFRLKDLAVEVDTVAKLKESILMQPGFTIANFRQTSFYRYGDVGIFASSVLRNYLLGVNKDPNEKAILIKLYYEPRQGTDSQDANEEPYHLYVSNSKQLENKVKSLLAYADDTLKKTVVYT